MDLIERLRDVSELEDIDHDICDTAYEAAMEIEELRRKTMKRNELPSRQVTSLKR